MTHRSKKNCSRRVIFGAGFGAGLAAVIISFATAVVRNNPKEPVCPSGAATNAERTRLVLQILESDAEGEVLLSKQKTPIPICYGNFSSGALTTEGYLLLSKLESDSSNAARAAHLLNHRLHLQRFDDGAQKERLSSCADIADQSIEEEISARAIENRIREASGLEPLSDDLSDLRSAYRSKCENRR